MPTQYVTRSDWGAQEPRKRIYVKSSDMEGIVIHHSVTPSGGDLDERVRNIQNYHRNTRGWFDVAYSYLIGQDGTVYEGRGSGVQQGATNQVNDRFYAVCFIGNYGGSCTCANPQIDVSGITDVLTEEAKESFRCLRKMLMDEGVGEGLRSHREFKATSCPGDNISNAKVLFDLAQGPVSDTGALQFQIDAMKADWALVKKITYRRIGARFKRIRSIAEINLERF